MIKNFQEDLVGVIKVSKRDGKLWVFDGNTRTTACKRKFNDDYYVRADVYTDLTYDEEARRFRTLNKGIKKITFNDDMRAAVEEKDPTIMPYFQALNDSKITWNYDGRGRSCTFRALSGGKTIFDRYGRDIFIKACDVLEDVKRREMMTGKILGGVAHLMLSNINRERLVSTLKKVDENDLERVARKHGKVSHNGRDKSNNISYALAIAEYYNNNLRKNKIEVHEQED